MVEDNLKEENHKKRNNSIEKNQKSRESYTPDIKWDAKDALISLIFLTVALVAVYFGSARLIEIFGQRALLNSSNIDNISFSVLYAIQTLLMLGVVWFFAIFQRKSSLRDLGFTYFSIGKTIWYSFVSLLFIFVMSFLYVYFTNSLFGIEAPSSKIDTLVRNQSISSSILIVVVTVIAPFSEEIFFRGFLYSAFKKKWGVNTGLFLSSFLFALVHLEPYSFIPIMIIGWLLAYLFEKTKSLMTPIFLHAVYNLILILIMLKEFEFIKLY